MPNAPNRGISKMFIDEFIHRFGLELFSQLPMRAITMFQGFRFVNQEFVPYAVE
jgi:hypothetical protein